MRKGKELASGLAVAAILQVPSAFQHYSKRSQLLKTMTNGGSMSFREFYRKSEESLKKRYGDDTLEMWRIEHWRMMFPTAAVYTIDVWFQAVGALAIAIVIKYLGVFGAL